MRKLIFIIVLFLNSNLNAQISWMQVNGPYGGNFNNISILNENEIFLDNYRSSDNGESWVAFNKGYYNSFRSVVKTPNGSLFASYKIFPNGYWYLYKSTNNGMNWFNVHSQMNFVRSIYYFDPYLIVINNGVIYRSNNDGAIFEAITNANYSFTHLIKKDIELYASTWGGYICKSSNMGTDWVQVGNYVPWGAISHIEISHNNFIFSSSSVNQLMRSTDMGISWDVSLPAKTRSAVSVGNHLIAATEYKGLMRSTDLGNSWDDPNDILFVNDLKKNSNNELFCSLNEFGFFKSANYGNTWEQKNVGLNEMIVNSFYKHENKIYSLTKDGIYESNDNGVNWNKIGPFGHNSMSLLIDGNTFLLGGSYKYLTTHVGNLSLSLDAGVNWININLPVFPFYQLNCFYKISNDTIIAGTNASSIISFDKGLSWNILNAAFNTINFTKFKNKIFAVTGNNVLFSYNGINWSISNLGLPNVPYSSIYYDEIYDVLYIGTSVGLYYTEDGINFLSTNFNKNVTATIRADSTSLFVASNGYQFWDMANGVWKSTDRGITWDSINTNLTNKAVTSILLTNDNHLLIGTNRSSVFKTTNPISINSILSEIPSSFSLSQNYPNPFNPATNIRFQIPESGFVALKVFDITGREVATLVNEQMNAGEYNYQFSTDDYQLGSGVYFYRLTVTSKNGEMNFSETKKMVLVR